MADTDIDIVAENLAELLTNTVDMASVFYDIFLNPNPMIVHLKAFDDDNRLIEVSIPNRAMDRITPYTGEGSPEGKVEAPIGSVYVDTMSSTVYYKVSGDANDPFGWNAVISQSLMETFIRTYLEARGYITTSSLRTYLITHEYVDVPYLDSYLTTNGYIRSGSLSSVPEANLDDKTILIDGDSEEVNGIAVGNLIASMISAQDGNSLTIGEDNKLFVDDGVTGVVAGTYVYPKNLVVNEGGRITSVEQGSQADITIATDVNYGIVRPDNSSIVVNEGVISSVTRNIGEIIASTLPLDDAGLHLLDGALISGSGSYAAFVNYVKDLRTNYSNLFTTESAWQTSVTNYGVCGKFVYDSANNTVRLPKITGFIEGGASTSVVGNLAQAGLPNITGTFKGGLMNSTIVATGAFRGDTYQRHGNDSDGAAGHYTVRFDASNSSGIYGRSSTVQPQSIKVLYYIVVANATKPDILVDIDNIASDLNGKLDKDLTNASNQTKVMLSSMSMPSAKYVNLTLGVSGGEYLAPANGYFNLSKNGGSAGQYIYFSTSTLSALGRCTASGAEATLLIPVRKGDKLKVSYTASGTTNFFRFIYAVGSESEAN